MKTHPDPLNEPRFEKLVARVRAQEGPEPSADFTERTLAQIKQAPAPRRSFPGIAALAASLALLLGAGLWLVRAPAPVRVAQAPTPIDVLMAAQRADGGWSADARHSRPRYDVGVTALALLALMHVEASPLEGPRALAIRSGLDHLMRCQGADGRFGEDFSGSGFTQYLAGMAMRTAAQLPDADPVWKLAAARAEKHEPTGVQMAGLNGRLAHPRAFPARWADAGGPVTLAALQMLDR